ncbi:PAS domain-containing protein [Alkalicaulis satelles]|uniref:histidine kinase n=1 Tax=Alkalicaulis satelles TaxID=2609175 RepID=A0A5M6ZGV8_9PROT|nr:PAS domain-containing protein [Alkalicaulis satelles]
MSDDKPAQTGLTVNSEAVLAALPDAAAVMDHSGSIIMVNPAFRQAFGKGPWAGRPVQDVPAPLTLRSLGDGLGLVMPGPLANTSDMPVSNEISAWTFDLASRHVRLTGPVLTLLGFPGAELTIDIDEWASRVAPADRILMSGATWSMMINGLADVEYRVRAQSGEYVWLNLRGGASEYSKDGQPVRYSGFVAGLEHRKRLDQAFIERERALGEAVSAGLAGSWNFDVKASRLTGRGLVMEWLGKPAGGGPVDPDEWLAIVHPDDQETALGVYKRLGRGEPVEVFDYRIRAKQGWRWVRTRGAVVARGKDGKALRVAGVLIDVTSERNYAAALEAEKQRFESLYRSTPVMLHSLDAQGRTLLVNDLWCARMGYSEEEARQRHGWDFFIAEDARRIREEIFPETIRKGSIDHVSLTALTRSGEPIEVRLSAFVEYDGEGQPLIAHGAFSDVSDLNEARRDLERQAAALERSNRELDRFATIASHDLQEPLRKISAFASLLSRRYQDQIDADGRQSLDYLVDAAGRMRRLIDDLLAYSRASKRDLEPEPVNLDALLTETLEGLSLMVAEARAEIDAGPLPEVQADLVLMRLLLQNLLTNALKYRKGPHVRIVVRAEREPDAWRITVADDGIGFDPRFAEKVFAPFPAPAHPRSLCRDRDRAGHLSAGGGAPWRAHLGGRRERARRALPLHPARPARRQRLTARSGGDRLTGPVKHLTGVCRGERVDHAKQAFSRKAGRKQLALRHAALKRGGQGCVHRAGMQAGADRPGRLARQFDGERADQLVEGGLGRPVAVPAAQLVIADGAHTRR